MRQVYRSALLAAGLLAIAAPVMAGGWYQQPSVRLRTGYDDNVRLRSTNQQEDFITTLQGDTTLGYRTETEGATLKLKAEANQYQQYDNLNNENLFADLNLDHKGERSNLGLLASLYYDTTLQSELETTGRVDNNLRVTRQIVQPNFSYSFGERWLGSISAGYNEVNYEDLPGVNLTDYRYVTAQSGMQYQVTEDRSFSGTLFANRYTPTAFDFISRGYGVNLGWQEKFSPNLTGSVSMGVRKDKSERTSFGIQTSDSSSGTQFDAALQKSWQRWRLSGNLSRSVEPSGDGNLIERDRLSGSISYDWSERLQFNFNASYLDIRQANDLFATNSDRRYITLQPRVQWLVQRNWRAGLDYRYRQNKSLDTNSTADGNAIFATLSYVWPSQLGGGG